MNLHGLVAPMVGAVNPLVPVTVQISAGPGDPSDDGTRLPTFETPGAISASIAGDVLTVETVTAGVLRAGQQLSGAGVSFGTEIVEQLSGSSGGPGTYRLDRSQAADVTPAENMTTSLILMAQVQPMTWRDLQQMEGLNLSGTRRKVYLYGSVDSVTRVSRRGGDLVTIANGGPDDGVWLVAQVLEQWPDWVCAAMTLQNED